MHRVSSVLHPTRHAVGHFGNESLQAIDCSGTDKRNEQKNKHRKFVPAKTNIKLQNPGFVAFYDIRPRSGGGSILSCYNPEARHEAIRGITTR